MTETLPFVDYQQPKNFCGIAIVGEAPGADEVKQGKPFVGRSGQLLDKNLKAAGIERAQCLVANVFRYQPPKNKVAHFFISKKMALATGEGMAHEWGKFGSACCRQTYAGELENLKATLVKLQPKIIVTLGATSLWALTGLSGILTLRGQLQTCRLMDGVKVMPTFHPSYILRGNWSEESKFMDDLKRAKELVL